jgi:hypothetical protein
MRKVSIVFTAALTACDKPPEQVVRHSSDVVLPLIYSARIDESRVALSKVVGGLISQRMPPYGQVIDDIINVLLNVQCDTFLVQRIDLAVFNDRRFRKAKFVWCDRVTLTSGINLKFEDGTWNEI